MFPLTSLMAAFAGNLLVEFLAGLTLSTLKDVADVAQSLATIVALVAGSIWSLHTYRRQRTSYPRLDTEILEPNIFDLKGHRHIRVEIRLFNRGSVIFKCKEAVLRLRSVLPIEDQRWDSIKSLLTQDFDPVKDDTCLLDFPSISNRTWGPAAVELEPGETDSLHADFVVRDDLEVAELYFYLKNPKKSNSGRMDFYQNIQRRTGESEWQRTHPRVQLNQELDSRHHSSPRPP